MARLPSLCMEFCTQEDLSGFPFPSPDPWTEVVFAALAGGFFTTQHFVHTCSVASAVRIFDRRTPACQAPLSVGFSRQEYWSGLPCPPPGDLPHPGIEPASLVSPILAGVIFTNSATWEPPDPPGKPQKTRSRRQGNPATCDILDCPGGHHAK